MTFRHLLLLSFLSVSVLTACSADPVPSIAPAGTPQSSVSPVPSTAPTSTPTPAPDPVEIQLSAMTVEEKVGQLLVAGLEGHAPGPDAQTAIRDYHVGGLIFFAHNVESAAQLAALTNAVKALNEGEIPLLLSVDQEGGRVERMPPEVLPLPSAQTFGAAGSATIAARFGRVLGAECAAFGLNTDYAPSLDVWSSPENTVIGDRAFGSDPDTVAELGTAAWQGITDRGVLPVVKHFPGHGDTAVDSHQDLPVVDKSREELEALELIPFRTAIRHQAPAVMVAHILEKGLDPDRPASLSPKVITELLREDLGFQGLVFTDDLTMGAIVKHYGVGEAAVLAVEAGCDMLLLCHGAEPLAMARAALLDAVSSGRISESRLDESVRRILFAKAEFRFTNDPVPSPDTLTIDAQIRTLLEQLPQP